MAVDLGDLIENLVGEVNVPGSNAFPDAIDDDWLIKLRNAFWDVKLDGLIGANYVESDGQITSTDASDPDLDRMLQQLIVLYAGISIVRNKLMVVNTLFRAKAGPVEYETQQAATVLTAVMNEFVYRRNIILTRLSDIGVGDPVYIDMIIARDESFRYNDTDWVSY
jgi:hypothetical protein